MKELIQIELDNDNPDWLKISKMYIRNSYHFATLRDKFHAKLKMQRS